MAFSKNIWILTNLISLVTLKKRLSLTSVLCLTNASWNWVIFSCVICFQHFLRNWDIFSWLLWRLTSIKTQRIYKKPRRLTKKCHFNRNPDLVTTLSLNVDSSKTFKKQEEAKSDVKIVESIVVSPKLFNIMRPWDIPDWQWIWEQMPIWPAQWEVGFLV